MAEQGWFVLTGAPCSGKSTTLEELGRLGYMVVPEAARVYIDQEIEKGKTLEEIRGDEARFQNTVLEMKFEIEEKLPKDRIVFLERGIPDSLAYAKLISHDFGAEWTQKAGIFSQYKKIFLLERLEYKKDYARVEEEEEAEKLHTLLAEAYQGERLFRIPVMKVQDRVQWILQQIRS